MIRDENINDPEILRVEIALNPLDNISWNAFGVKNHDVLILADKGLILRLPKTVTLPQFKSVYRDIVASWVIEASSVARSTSPVNDSGEAVVIRPDRSDC